MNSLIDQFARARKATQECLAAICRFGEEPAMLRTGRPLQQLDTRTWLNPVGLLVHGARFFLHWMSTRSTEAFCLGIPALGTGIVLVYMICVVAPSRDVELRQAERLFHASLDRDDLAEAEFQLGRMCFLNPSEPNFLFRRVELLERMGRSADARLLAIELASRHQHGKSLLWLAAGTFASIREADHVNPELDRQFLDWANAARTNLPATSAESQQVALMLGTFYLLRDRPELAASCLETASRTSVEAQLSLAILYRRLERFDTAKATASHAADRFDRQVTLDPQDTQVRARYLKAMLIAERESEAVSCLRGIQTLFPEMRALHSELADAYASWSQRVLDQGNGNARAIVEASQLIFEGLRCDATNLNVMRQLIRLTCRREFDDPTTEQHLQDALAAGAAPGMIHFILGTRALNRSDFNLATTHFEVAAAHNASYPGLLNNLAVSLSSGDTTDLTSAGMLADRAVSMMPDEPRFRDTRGRILLKLGETTRAIADLEVALRSPELRPEIHHLLTAAYANSGADELVRRHRALARRFQSDEADRTGTPSTAQTQSAERKTAVSIRVTRDPSAPLE